MKYFTDEEIKQFINILFKTGGFEQAVMDTCIICSENPKKCDGDCKIHTKEQLFKNIKNIQ